MMQCENSEFSVLCGIKCSRVQRALIVGFVEGTMATVVCFRVVQVVPGAVCVSVGGSVQGNSAQ